MILNYDHNSPLAPSFESLSSTSTEGPSTTNVPIDKVFSQPLAELPTKPLTSPSFVRTLLLSESSASPLSRISNRSRKQSWRRPLKNLIDYTTVRKKEMKDYFEQKEFERIEAVTAFQRFYSPQAIHIPVIKKIILKIWDERAAANK
jgi:hypothetical protein